MTELKCLKNMLKFIETYCAFKIAFLMSSYKSSSSTSSTRHGKNIAYKLFAMNELFNETKVKLRRKVP